MTEEDYYQGNDFGIMLSAISELVHLEEAHEIGDGINKDASKPAIMDNANVLMLVPKSERAKRLLKPYRTNYKVPDLAGMSEKKLHVSGYSREYLSKILSFFEKSGSGTLTFSLSTDYPVIVEDSDWQIILAPRSDRNG